MGILNVGVIARQNETDSDVILRLSDLMEFVKTRGKEFNTYNDSLYYKIHTESDGMDERLVVIPSGEYPADTFPFDEEHLKLNVQAVLDEEDVFYTDGYDARNVLDARNRELVLYVFECYY